MNRLTKVASIHNNEPEFYEANIDLYPEMMGYEHQQAEMDCIHKLGELEDLEEELGCPLEVVFKALKENISFQREDIITKEVHILEGFDSYIIYNKGRKRYELHTTFKVGRSNWIADLDLQDYGKTWWLKGEKNETI